MTQSLVAVPTPGDDATKPLFISHIEIAPPVLRNRMSLQPSPLKSCVPVAGGRGTRRAMLFALFWVNHSAPSEPAAMPVGRALGDGTQNTLIEPAVVIRPIWLDPARVNHSAPSGPVVMDPGAWEKPGRV